MNCSFCNKEVTDATSIPWKTKVACLECAVSTIRCIICDELHHIDNLTYHPKVGFSCPSCEVVLKKCSCCGLDVVGYEDVKGTIICRSCLKKNYFKCSSCNEYHIKLNAISELEFMQYSHVFQEKETCKNCLNAAKATHTAQAIEKCSICGRYTSSFVTHDEDGTKIIICKEHGCLENSKICYCCGKWHMKYAVNGDGKPFCCACEHLHRYCHACSKFYLAGDIISGMCTSCAATKAKCRRCGGYHDKTKMKSDSYGEIVELYCPKCYTYSKRDCPVCNINKHGVIERGANGTCCLKCKIDSPLGEIHGYSYKPDAVFLPTFESATTLYLGIENEITFGGDYDLDDDCWCSCSEYEDGDDEDCDCPCHSNGDYSSDRYYLLKKAGMIEKAFPKEVYNKRDGSVSNGFEVVFHPMTFDYFKRQKWSKLFKDVNPSPDNKCCGMHIHMSKAAFSQAHLYKFMAFIHDNVHFVEKVAERTENTYTMRLKKDTLVSKAHDKSFYERYEAVNLQNAHTVEVRVFRGAVCSKQFEKNVEFVVALYEFTRKYSLRNITLDNFKVYVEENKDRFANLYTFINR